ncbi:hypothetical protein HA466_0268830 [Hirschfeldia incana]|nr:hypothetical protein HA466_0268830 [Hirschfeldia incana]
MGLETSEWAEINTYTSSLMISLEFDLDRFKQILKNLQLASKRRGYRKNARIKRRGRQDEGRGQWTQGYIDLTSRSFKHIDLSYFLVLTN